MCGYQEERPQLCEKPETEAQRTKESGLQTTILGSPSQDAVVPHRYGVSRGGSAAPAAEGCRAGGTWVERWETSGMSGVRSPEDLMKIIE